MATFTLITGEHEVKLSSGINLIEHKRTFYESTTNIIYKVETPSFSTFLANYTCTDVDAVCSAFNHIIKLENETMRILKMTLPQVTDFEVENKLRKTREGILWLSTPLRYCCGVAQTNQIEELQKSQGDLQRYLDNMKAQIDSDHAHAVKETEVLNSYSDEMKKYLKDSQAKNDFNLGQVLKTTSVLEEKIAILEDIASILGKTDNIFAATLNFAKGIEMCKGNMFPYPVIDESILMNDIKTIEKEIHAHDHKLAISTANTIAYHNLRTTSCYYTSTHLIVRMKIPILRISSAYKLYELYTLPFYHDGKVCSIDLKTRHIIQKNKQIYPVDDDACISSQGHLCYTAGYPKIYAHNHHCIEIALNSRNSLGRLRKACTFTCSTYNAENMIILDIARNEFGILAPNSTLEIICGQQNTTTITTHEEVGITILKLECGCNAYIKDEEIRTQYPCTVMDKEKTTATHLIAAQWSLVPEETIITRYSRYHNYSKIFNKNWNLEIPTIDLTEPKQIQYELPAHVEHASYVSWSSIGIILIIIIVIGIMIWKGKTISKMVLELLNPEMLASRVLSFIFGNLPSVTGAPLAHEENNLISAEFALFTFETLQTFILVGILACLIIIIVKMQRSQLFNIFERDMSNCTKARIKITAINEEDENDKAKCIRKDISLRNLTNKQILDSKEDTSKPGTQEILSILHARAQELSLINQS